MVQKTQVKEDSGLASLRELMSLEEDRIRREEEERRRRLEADASARADSERRAREAEEARLRADEERRQQEEQRKREEAARLEAIRLAEIEKARVEAEQKARLEAISRQQEHERHMKTLQHDERHKALKRWTYVSALGALVVLVGAVAIYFGKIKPEHERSVMAQRIALQEREDEARKLLRQMEEANGRIEGLKAQLESASNEVQKAEIRRKLDEAQARQAALKETKERRPSGGGGEKPAKKKDCTCQAGDPLCSCL